jgi:hypothetical protein
LWRRTSTSKRRSKGREVRAQAGSGVISGTHIHLRDGRR